MSEVELDILIDHYTKKTKKDMFEYIERKTGYTKDELTCRKQLCLVRQVSSQPPKNNPGGNRGI